MTKNEIQEIVARLCGTLDDLGCAYEFKFDNRSDRKSAYIYVRRPKYMEIRVSDHPPGKHHRKQFDIGPHGITPEVAIEQIAAIVRL